MSRRRYISTSISVDRAVNSVAMQSDFAALLYTWMVPHAEEDGTITADPDELLMMVLPGRRDKTPADVALALDLLCVELLIEHEGRLYFPHESFYRYQSSIHESRRRDWTPERAEPLTTARNSAEQRTTARNAASSSSSSSSSSSESNHQNGRAVSMAFTSFWEEYPRKVGKRDAQKAFERASKRATTEAIIAGLRRQLTDLLKQERAFIPHPSTWLNADRWEDEAGTESPVGIARTIRDQAGESAARAYCEQSGIDWEAVAHA